MDHAHKVFDAMSSIEKWKQNGTVQEYYDRFMAWVQNTGMKESHVIDFFVSGLHPEIEKRIKMFEPKSLSDAYRLAHLQEKTNEVMKRKNAINYKTNPSNVKDCEKTVLSSVKEDLVSSFGSDRTYMPSAGRKKEDPLSLIKLNSRIAWNDEERDTSLWPVGSQGISGCLSESNGLQDFGQLVYKGQNWNRNVFEDVKYEKGDSLGTRKGLVSGAGLESGLRPKSLGMGWTKHRNVDSSEAKVINLVQTINEAKNSNNSAKEQSSEYKTGISVVDGIFKAKETNVFDEFNTHTNVMENNGVVDNGLKEGKEVVKEGNKDKMRILEDVHEDIKKPVAETLISSENGVSYQEHGSTLVIKEFVSMEEGTLISIGEECVVVIQDIMPVKKRTGIKIYGMRLLGQFSITNSRTDTTQPVDIGYAQTRKDPICGSNEILKLMGPVFHFENSISQPATKNVLFAQLQSVVVQNNHAEKLTQLMQPDSFEKKLDLASRTRLEDVISVTDQFECVEAEISRGGYWPNKSMIIGSRRLFSSHLNLGTSADWLQFTSNVFESQKTEDREAEEIMGKSVFLKREELTLLYTRFDLIDPCIRKSPSVSTGVESYRYSSHGYKCGLISARRKNTIWKFDIWKWPNRNKKGHVKLAYTSLYDLFNPML